MSSPRSHLSGSDLVRTGVLGLTTRKMRAALSALGIAIGIASIVGVLAVSESSRADLLEQLDELGTNLLVVSPGRSFAGEDAALPYEATEMAARIGPVESAAAVTDTGQTVRRTDHIPEGDTSGLAVFAASTNLPETLGITMADGRWLDAATAQYPTVVLGAKAAERLGITNLDESVALWIGEQWFTVIGILDPLALQPELDRSVLVGEAAAAALLDSELNPSLLYVRTDPDRVVQVRDALPRTVMPANPEQALVTRPSDVLEAEAAAKTTFRSMFLGLGAIALLVGTIGVANVMIISVLERRREIGLRRAIGARRVHVAGQFLTEALLLSAVGGAIGAGIGVAVGFGYAQVQGWHAVVPPMAIVGALATSVAVGAIAGLYPAVRAARLSPTDALRTV